MTESSSAPSGTAPVTPPQPPPTTFKEAVLRLLHPVPLIALLIVSSVIALIGVSLLGVQNDVLLQMSRAPFARGLITYLFAVVTIGTAVVLIVSVLTGGSATDEQFQRAKDILGLLLGVFGTIVGYYFGTEHTGMGPAAAAHLAVGSLAPESPLTGGELTTLEAHVIGGTAPYRFVVFLRQGGTPVAEGEAQTDGRVVARFRTPSVGSDSSLAVQLLVVDANDDSVRTISTLPIKPR